MDCLDELGEGGLLGYLDLNWDENAILDDEHGSLLMLAQSSWLGLVLFDLIDGLNVARDEFPCTRRDEIMSRAVLR